MAALNVRVVRASDLVRAKADGEVHFNDTVSLLNRLAAAAASLEHYSILLDMREAQSRLSEVDLWHLAAELPGFDRTFQHPTAVVAQPGRFDMAKFFALASQNHGFPVRAFEGFEQAIDWLHQQQETQSRAPQ